MRTMLCVLVQRTHRDRMFVPGIVIIALTVVVPTFRALAQVRAERLTAATYKEPDSASSAQNVPTQLQPDRMPEWHSMVTNIPGDWVRSGQRCVEPEGLRTIVGISMLTGFLIASDGSTYRYTRKAFEHNAWMRSGSDVLEHAGNGVIHLGVAASFALGGLIAGDSRAVRTASQTVEGLLASGIVVQVLKHVTGRESPAAASAEGGIWRFFPNLKAYQRDQAKYYAFPSGHITTTMSTVTIIAENYPELEWVRPVGYTLVGLVGVSLVGVRFHWYSDLPLGIAIGYTIGAVVARRDTGGDRAVSGSPTRPFTVRPSIGPGGAGVSLQFSF